MRNERGRDRQSVQTLPASRKSLQHGEGVGTLPDKGSIVAPKC